MKNKALLKAAAAFICLVMLASVFSGVSAFETVEAGKLNIVIDGGTERKEAAAGSEVEIKVNLVNNTTISSLKARISWPDALELVNAEYGIYNKEDSTEMAIMPDAGADGKPDWSGVKGHFTFNWISAFNEVKGDVNYVTMTFKVKADAKEGDFLAVKAEIDPESVFDKDTNNIPFKLIDGGVYVTAPSGDTAAPTDSKTVTDAETKAETEPKNNTGVIWIIVIIAAVVVCAAAAALVVVKKRKAAK